MKFGEIIKIGKKFLNRYNETKIESNTTLPLLLKEICPEKCFIILPDTLIENIVDNNSEHSYKEYCGKIEEDVKNFITSAVVCDEDKNKCEILILPRVGTFNKTKFIGNPKNFYIFFYNIISKEIFNLNLPSDNNQIEIILDITHGINYMTLMIYSAIKDICDILAYFYSVKFIVLNSDPKVGSTNDELNINEIEKVNINPKLNLYRFNSEKLVIPAKTLTEKDKKEIGKNAPNVKGEILSDNYAFAGSILNGLLIFLYHFFPNICNIEKIIGNSISYFYQHIEIKKDKNQKIIISQNVDFTKTLQSLQQILLISKLFQIKYRISKENSLKLSDIEKLKDIYNFYRTIKQRLEKEIKKIKDNKNILTKEFQDYGVIASKDYNPSRDSNFDERNFYAHCGFGYNIIQLKNENDEILIKVKDDFLNQIKENIVKNIQIGDYDV